MRHILPILLILLGLFGTEAYAATGIPVLQDSGGVVWNETGVFVKVPLFNVTHRHYGVAVYAYYNSSDTIVLVAEPYIELSEPVNVTFELWDYWNKSLIGKFNVSGVYVVENVTTNITIIYYNITTATYTERYGPYYISYMPTLTTMPSELQVFGFLLLVAFLVAFAGRGNTRDVGLGIIIFGILITIIASVFGLDTSHAVQINIIAVTVGMLLLGVHMITKR